MSTFIRAAIGPFAILIDANLVLEVCPAMTGEGNAAPLWRGVALPAVDGHEVFAVPDGKGERTAIVLKGAAEVPFVLQVERVIGSRTVEEGAFQPLPHLPQRVAALFDGVLWDESGRLGALRLRRDVVPAELAAILCGADGRL
jgi:hypothetical protein